MSLFKTTPTLRAIALTGLLGAASLGAMAQAEKPQYGGTLNIGMVYVTLSPLSWDPADWAWKFGQDTGLMYEQLFAADLNKSVRKGGKYPFVADAWLPTVARSLCCSAGQLTCDCNWGRPSGGGNGGRVASGAGSSA